MMKSMTIGCISAGRHLAVKLKILCYIMRKSFHICMLNPHIYLMMDRVAVRQRAHINHTLTAQEGISLSLSIWIKCVFSFF